MQQDCGDGLDADDHENDYDNDDNNDDSHGGNDTGGLGCRDDDGHATAPMSIGRITTITTVTITISVTTATMDDGDDDDNDDDDNGWQSLA